MKKIVINGGNFYKLYQVYTVTRNFSANTATALLDGTTEGTIYRFEVSNTSDSFTLHNGSQTIAGGTNSGGPVVEGGNAVYIARMKSDNSVSIRFASAVSNVTVTIYEVFKYGDFMFKATSTTGNSLKGYSSCNEYLQPVPKSGDVYHFEFTPQYDGYFHLYGSDNTVLIDKTACTSGQKITYNYTAVSDGGYVQIRTYETDALVKVVVNKT